MQCFKSSKQRATVGQILLAHGAGAGSQSDFMQRTATLMAEGGVTTWLFDFSYMQRMMAEGKRRPPDRMPKLQAAFNSAIDEVQLSPDYDATLGLYIGGKSMGGRVATHLLTSDVLQARKPDGSTCSIMGGVILGYPFTPPGKQNLRTEHFDDMARPVIIAQGQRDAFGGEALVSELNLPESITTIILPDGDHSFKPRKASGESLEGNMELMVNRALEWMCRTKR